MLCRGAEQLLHDAERNAEVLVLKLEAAAGGLPFKLPPRRPQSQQQANRAGAVINANEIITETLVDFSSVQVRLNSEVYDTLACSGMPSEAVESMQQTDVRWGDWRARLAPGKSTQSEALFNLNADTARLRHGLPAQSSART